MKTVFNNIYDISELFIAQTQYFAGTPLTYIKGQSKGRRFYFKGDTIYSYRDSYPLAKIIGDKLYIKEETYSNPTGFWRRTKSRIIETKLKQIKSHFPNSRF